MQLTVRASNRSAALTYDAKPTAAKLREQILRGDGVESDFSVITAPAAAHEPTAFKVVGNERRILVGIAMYDMMTRALQRADGRGDDSLEILFDPRNDGLGWQQFIFSPPRSGQRTNPDPHRDPDPGDTVIHNTHWPYPEAHSSRPWEMKLLRHKWTSELISPCPITQVKVHWLFAWFDAGQVFAAGDACGLNICRARPSMAELSSWNYAAGNGFPDAQSFGRLHRGRGPARIGDVTASLSGDKLTIQGRVTPARGRLMLELADPLDDRTKLRATVRGGRFRASTRIDTARDGRYRLYAIIAGRRAEPDYVSIDVPSGRRAASYVMSVTYDSPMSIIANHYTPARLDADMALWNQFGVKRLHWIEYGDWPSFWSLKQHQWADNYARTRRACGDPLTAAVKAAHRAGLQLVADLKTFDLGLNCFMVPDDGRSAALELENRYSSVIPEIAANPQWTLQAHADWHREASFPITKIRLYSDEPLPRVQRSEVRLLTSRTNRRYKPYGGRMTLRQGVMRRPHERWTPAGNVRDKGTQRCWFIELDGLRVRDPFVAVSIGDGEARFVARAFRLAEAWSDAGETQPITVATNGTAQDGYFFWKGWQGWANHTEALLQQRAWRTDNVGLVFAEAPNMPAMLEPAYEGARRIWLGRAKTILDSGADGVDIRTYCHHNGPMQFLKYAFAAPVRETFQSMYGRAPRADFDDYQRIRMIRGDCYTQFMREVKKLTAARGRLLTVEIESGVEVPVELDVRMHLPLDWRRWIEQGIVDEVRLKWFTAESRFVQEQVLPVARRHGVPVHLISRCLHTGIDERATEMARLLAAGNAAAGFDGYNLYEQQNLMDMNPLGVQTLKGPVRAFFAEVRRSLAEAAGTGAAVSNG